MRVQVTLPQGYHNAGGVHGNRGDIIEVGVALASKLIARGMAVPVREPEIETATVAPPETTARRVQKRQRVRKSSK